MTQQPPNYPPPSGGGYEPPARGYEPPPVGGYQPSGGGYQPQGGGYRPPGGYPPPYGGYQPPPPSAGTNGLAIASLVCSLIGWVVCPFVAEIVGVIFGFVALGQIKQSGQGGRGLALAGIIIGGMAVVLGVLGLILAIAYGGTHTTTTTY